MRISSEWTRYIYDIINELFEDGNGSNHSVGYNSDNGTRIYYDDVITKIIDIDEDEDDDEDVIKMQKMHKKYEKYINEKTMYVMFDRWATEYSKKNKRLGTSASVYKIAFVDSEDKPAILVSGQDYPSRP
jgi:hypothetical protein